MLAIHNHTYKALVCTHVANAFAKLSKCQQFTTILFQTPLQILLQTLLQSYQNVSNSQLYVCSHIFYFCCKRFCKVIKMLAIHNNFPLLYFLLIVANAFAKLSKCQQFTTSYLLNMFLATLQTLLQSYQNVSNSQHRMGNGSEASGCKRFCKVIKMLAIHNLLPFQVPYLFVANAFAKLSKCQQFTTH